MSTIYKYLNKAWTKVNKIFLFIYLGKLKFNLNKFGIEKLGSDYGGWFVPVELIKQDWICYSGGAGEDISFEMDLKCLVI